MVWKVSLLVLVLAVALASSEEIGDSLGDFVSSNNKIVPSRKVDAAGVPITDTNTTRTSDTAKKLDAEEVIINEREFPMIGEEARKEYNGNSIEERKQCVPTLCCIRAGGYCIRNKANCNGTVDAQGCKRNKCKCCIPDQSTSTPVTCPTTHTTNKCPAVTPCPTSAISTTSIPTTHAATSEDSTDDPNLTWLSVGVDRFVRFSQKITWFDARRLCQSYGLDLYEPKDIKAVSVYLENNFSDRWYWIGARTNGTHHVWLSGGVIPSTAPWYPNGYSLVSSGRCMEIITHSGFPSRDEILYPLSENLCSRTGYQDVLCG